MKSFKTLFLFLILLNLTYHAIKSIEVQNDQAFRNVTVTIESNNRVKKISFYDSDFDDNTIFEITLEQLIYRLYGPSSDGKSHTFTFQEVYFVIAQNDDIILVQKNGNELTLIVNLITADILNDQFHFTRFLGRDQLLQCVQI